MEEDWQRQYSRFNKDNLETLDVIKDQGSKYYFVERNHPVIGLIKYNEARLGIVLKKFNTEMKEDGKWYYKVADRVMETSCDVLRNEVFGVKQESQINIQEELRAIKYELEWQNECFRVLFSHLGLKLPTYETQRK